MARPKFPLKMQGKSRQTLDDLRAYFNLEATMEYYASGKLRRWLADRYCDQEVAAVDALSEADSELGGKLCVALGVPCPAGEERLSLETVKRRAANRPRLEALTDDPEILSHPEWAAFGQGEFEKLLNDGLETIYLCHNRFSLPDDCGRDHPVQLIGVGKTVMENPRELLLEQVASFLKGISIRQGGASQWQVVREPYLLCLTPESPDYQAYKEHGKFNMKGQFYLELETLYRLDANGEKVLLFPIGDNKYQPEYFFPLDETSGGIVFSYQIDDWLIYCIRVQSSSSTTWYVKKANLADPGKEIIYDSDENQSYTFSFTSSDIKAPVYSTVIDDQVIMSIAHRKSFFSFSPLESVVRLHDFEQFNCAPIFLVKPGWMVKICPTAALSAKYSASPAMVVRNV